jgi:hypothetical protein
MTPPMQCHRRRLEGSHAARPRLVRFDQRAQPPSLTTMRGGAAAEVRVLELAGQAKKGDVSDWIGDGWRCCGCRPAPVVRRAGHRRRWRRLWRVGSFGVGGGRRRARGPCARPTPRAGAINLPIRGSVPSPRGIEFRAQSEAEGANSWPPGTVRESKEAVARGQSFFRCG